MSTQADVPAQVDMSSRVDARGRRDVHTQGDYEAVAKCTRSASTHSSIRLVKKPHHSLMTKLAKKLPSSQCTLEVLGVATKISEPVAATQEATSKVALAISEPTVIIVIGEGTSAIPSPPVMIPGMTLLPAVL